ncbi:hypothetical protein DVH24_011788 [Malus domestica]|uniref:Uncharacterized protein n=1 Tax=Malus domestica TaxID=3750 RepID=A0A498JZL7_MALDO|nr:hypothetical protein DVH24_011788 [Malus domestica]
MGFVVTTLIFAMVGVIASLMVRICCGRGASANLRNRTKILNDCEATARGAETATLPEAELLLQHTKMYPSNSSSLPQKPMAPRPSTTGLTRYGSVPSSIINSVVDYVIGIAADFDFLSLRSQPLIGHYFSGDGHGDSSSLTSSESTFKVNLSNDGYRDAALPSHCFDRTA